MLLIASYIFYGSWDWRFLSLIFISTIVDYICGIKIHETKEAKQRKKYLAISIFVNLFILGFFKYYNFFANNFCNLISYFGLTINPSLVNVILPVGISFYTFQTMSYTIDIYRKELKPTHDFYDFALFVAFFPQLVAGPIERAKRLLPQITSPREIKKEDFIEGVYLIAYGLFQKVFVADNLSKIVETVYSINSSYNGSAVLIATYAFAFQIFCDFAGYSNIARGLAKCMGINLMVNFNLPYFAKNPSEFWKKWHISLSSWLKDYLYIPLGGNRKGKFNTFRNLLITMFLGGLWHGAAWTFIVWGLYHGILLIIYRLANMFIKIEFTIKNNILKKFWNIIQIILFFHVVCYGWLIFRAQSIKQCFNMTMSLLNNFTINPDIYKNILYLLYFALPLIIIQIIQYVKKDLMIFMKWSFNKKICFYLVMISLCLYVMILGKDALIGGGSEFIYFQF